jgi:hypothetical protein
MQEIWEANVPEVETQILSLTLQLRNFPGCVTLLQKLYPNLYAIFRSLDIQEPSFTER